MGYYDLILELAKEHNASDETIEHNFEQQSSSSHVSSTRRCFKDCIPSQFFKLE